MRHLTFLIVFSCATSVFAQAGFDCAPLGPLPLNPAANCEGVCSNSVSPGTVVTNAISCGFPVGLTQYLRIEANGPLNGIPGGGPLPRPVAGLASEVRIPIPLGATTVSFSWDFFNAEGAGSFFNDGMSIDVVTPTGNLVGNLAYADAFTPLGTCTTVTGPEVMPNGANSFVGPLPPYSPCDYISIVVWNFADNAVSSAGFVDSISFDAVGGGCPPPAYIPPPNDSCLTATFITEGTPVTGSSAFATTGPDPVTPNCGFNPGLDVWYSFVASCTGTYTVSTCAPGTDYDTVVTVWSGSCGSLVELACNDDNCNGPNFLSSSLTFSATAAQIYYISVAGYFGAFGNHSLLVSSGGGMALNWNTPAPGCIGYTVTGAPQLGSAFTAVTLNAGAYPNDWFFGIAITLTDLANQVFTGFPFTIAVDNCGNGTVGPFCGLPSGLTVYAVTLGTVSGGSFPSVVSAPATATIP